MRRTLATVVLLLSVAFLPAWVSVVLGATLCVAFERYFESVVAGIVLDMISAVPVPSLGGFLHFYFSVALGVVLLSMILRATTSIIPSNKDDE